MSQTLLPQKQHKGSNRLSPPGNKQNRTPAQTQCSFTLRNPRSDGYTIGVKTTLNSTKNRIPRRTLNHRPTSLPLERGQHRQRQNERKKESHLYSAQHESDESKSALEYATEP